MVSKPINTSVARASILPHSWQGAYLFAAFFALAPAAAFGQASQATATTTPPPPLAVKGQLQDVVVTTRHRAERAQSVPISMTTVSASQIKNLGSINLGQIKQLVPSLTINGFNPRNYGLDIRGLGSVGFVGYDGLENGVGTYIDGVLVGRSIETAADIPGIQDIEVLRGPQGTLFGKNAVAGAVVITTKLPSFKPEADFSASYGSYHYWQLQGYATSAIGDSDKAAVSLAVHATQNEGFVKNVVTGQNYYNTDDKGVRAQVLLEPNPDLTVRIIGSYDRWKSNCCVYSPDGIMTNYANGAPVTPSITTRLSQVGYSIPTEDIFKRETDLDATQWLGLETGNLSVQADYNLNGFTITSITAGSYYNFYDAYDADGLGAFIDNANPGGTTYQRQFTQELRVTSPTGGPIDYTGGLYFLYANLHDLGTTIWGTDAAAIMADSTNTAVGSAYSIDSGAYNGLQDATFDDTATYSTAAYGQATWHINPKLDLTGGVRFTYEEKTGDYSSTQLGGVAIDTLPTSEQAAVLALRNASAPNTSYSLRHSDMLPGGLVTLSYKPDENILLYATYSHGEKSAGLNLVAAAVPHVVAPEKLDNWEGGVKTALFNHRLLLNGDAFWDEDTNFQATINGYVGAVRTTYLANVPKVRSRGLEGDAHALVGDNLSLFASAIFNEAVYQSDPAAGCPIEVINVKSVCSLTGRPVAGSSKWTGSLGGEYDYPLGDIRGQDSEAYFGGNMLLRTGFFSDADDSEYSHVPGYAVGNITFGVRQADGGWDLSGWVHNFTNAHYYVYRSVAANTFPFYNRIYGQAGDPLTFGVTLRGKFH